MVHELTPDRAVAVVAAVRTVAASPGWLALPGRTVVVLGAGVSSDIQRSLTRNASPGRYGAAGSVGGSETVSVPPCAVSAKPSWRRHPPRVASMAQTTPAFRGMCHTFGYVPHTPAGKVKSNECSNSPPSTETLNFGSRLLRIVSTL